MNDATGTIRPRSWAAACVPGLYGGQGGTACQILIDLVTGRLDSHPTAGILHTEIALTFLAAFLCSRLNNERETSASESSSGIVVITAATLAICIYQESVLFADTLAVGWPSRSQPEGKKIECRSVKEREGRGN